MVRVVVASAEHGGKAVERPWLGARLQAVTPDIADSLGLKRPAGALVANVERDSPAAQGGLKAGDLILSVDGQIVDDPNAFDYRFATKPLGGTAELGLLRAGRTLSAKVALRLAPSLPRNEITIRSRSPFSGAKVANLSPALADELQLQNAEEGVVILDIDAGSYASNVGFRRGDVIVAVNGEKIAKTQDLARATETPNRTWRVIIRRGGQQISAVFNG
jgi:S1-C subfamily serine protease